MLMLPTDVRGEIEAWIRAGYPEETCGLLVGRHRHARTETARATLAKNLNRQRARDRYELAPADFLAADLAARAEGLEIVGVWHSHPDHPAEPSETDRAAAWEGWSYVIVEVTRAGVAAVRSWRLQDERFHEEPITSS
ncbi:MAG: Mov34/MPN/PAD-1 family protein [Planctomycetota bacterium]